MPNLLWGGSGVWIEVARLRAANGTGLMIAIEAMVAELPKKGDAAMPGADGMGGMDIRSGR